MHHRGQLFRLKACASGESDQCGGGGCFWEGGGAKSMEIAKSTGSLVSEKLKTAGEKKRLTFMHFYEPTLHLPELVLVKDEAFTCIIFLWFARSQSKQLVLQIGPKKINKSTSIRRTAAHTVSAAED